MVDPKTILEVGSWAGQSLVAWDEAAGGRAKLIAVDQWKPYFMHGGDPYDEMNRAAETGEIFELFKRNIRACGIEDRVSVLRGDSRDILPKIDRYSVNILFVDGDHRYEFVKQDIINAMPLVRIGGVLCGDDLEMSMESVSDITSHQAAVEQGLDFANGYHPGVTQAVYDTLGNVTILDGLWAMRKVDDNNWQKL